MFEHVLILVTPSGGIIVGKAKERACPARRTNLVFLFGREKVKLEGDFKGGGSVTLTPALSPQGRGRSRKGNIFLGAVEPLAPCLHDVARVHDGHAEGGEIDVPILVMGGGDKDEIVFF
jgi:hypothetical protein